MKQGLEEEEPAGARWIAVEVAEAVGDRAAEEQGGLSSADQGARPVYSTTELHRRRLAARMALKTHQSVQRHMHWHGCHDATQTGAVSDAAFEAAAFAGDAALVG